MKDPRFIGYSPNRLSREPEEALFAKEWQTQNNRNPHGYMITTLAYLLDPEHQMSPEEPSERDYKVAATVIQWLGSPVGQGFLEKCGYVKKAGTK